MLEVRNLSAGYGSVTVLHGVDIAVAPGEIVALLGANGAGKSTLVKAISGLLPLHGGEISLGAHRIDRHSPRRRILEGIVHVPEGRQIFGGLSVAENLRLGAYTDLARIDSAELERRMREVCNLFPPLATRLADPAANLSGGQQQMVAIGRGLMGKPKLLILDEPSLGLAPTLVADMFRLIASFRSRGLAVLLSEQNARSALAIADRAVVLEKGSVVLQGKAAELLNRPEVAERYLGVGRSVGEGQREAAQQLAARLKAILDPS